MENSSTGRGLLAADVWAASQAPDNNGMEYSCGAAARHPTGPEVSAGLSLLVFGGVTQRGIGKPPEAALFVIDVRESAPQVWPAFQATKVYRHDEEQLHG